MLGGGGKRLHVDPLVMHSLLNLDLTDHVAFGQRIPRAVRLPK